MPRSYHPRSIKAADIFWCYGTTGFPAKWFLRNERRNSILMTRHYPDLGSASDWLCGKFASANQKRYPDLGSVTSSVWNFCTPLSDVIFRIVGFFLRLVIPWLNAFAFYLSSLMSYRYSQFQPSVSELNPYSSVANITPVESESIWLFFNPLSPNSDQHQFSPNHIHRLSRD